MDRRVREGTFFIGGVGRGILEFFVKKVVALPLLKRGKCACGECEDFMRSDGATCGYCGCLPTRHSKKDARHSSDSVGGTSATGTSESASPEKWKDEDLGWFSNPKAEYTEFSNSILPKFYLSYWTTCPYKEPFHHCFVTERKHQWEVRGALKAINHRTPRGNIKIWAKADTGRERQLC